MYKSVFMFFGKGDEQLALDADSLVCRKEEGGPPPHPHTPPLLPMTHCSVAEVNKNINRKVAGSARHPEALSTLYFLWVESKGQPSWSHCSTFSLPTSPDLLPHFLPSFLYGPVMSLLPPCCGVTDRQRLLLAASPVDTVVMSLSPGSTIGHPRPPQWAAPLVYSFGEWGGEPRRDGETV